MLPVVAAALPNTCRAVPNRCASLRANAPLLAYGHVVAKLNGLYGASVLCGRFARVAELADALASGASARKGVGVQVPPRARGEVKEISFTGLANREKRSEIFGFLAVSCFCGGRGGAVTGRGGAGEDVGLVPGTPSSPSGGGWLGAVQFGGSGCLTLRRCLGLPVAAGAGGPELAAPFRAGLWHRFRY